MASTWHSVLFFCYSENQAESSSGGASVVQHWTDFKTPLWDLNVWDMKFSQGKWRVGCNLEVWKRKTATLATSSSLIQSEAERDEKGDRVRDRLREGWEDEGGEVRQKMWQLEKGRGCERRKTKGKETETEHEMAALEKKDEKKFNEIQTERRVRALGKQKNLELKNSEIMMKKPCSLHNLVSQWTNYWDSLKVFLSQVKEMGISRASGLNYIKNKNCVG